MVFSGKAYSLPKSEHKRASSKRALPNKSLVQSLKEMLSKPIFDGILI
jgi:hypothetical protein